MKKLIVILLLVTCNLFAGATREENCPGKVIAASGATAVMTFALPNTTASGGAFNICVQATDASNNKIISCQVQAFAAVNISNSITAALGTPVVAESSPVGSLTFALGQTNSGGVVTLNITPTFGSFTPSANSVIANINVTMPSAQDIAMVCLP